MPAPPAVAVAPAAAPTLSSLQGRKRVLLVFAPRADAPDLAEQARGARALAAQGDDRDLHIVTVAGDRVEGLADAAGALRGRLHVEAGAFRVVLVGKDGHAAVSSTRPLSAAALAARIDAMPMRREEMRRSGRRP